MIYTQQKVKIFRVQKKVKIYRKSVNFSRKKNANIQKSVKFTHRKKCKFFRPQKKVYKVQKKSAWVDILHKILV